MPVIPTPHLGPFCCDSLNNENVKPGNIGELLIYGYAVSKGYYNGFNVTDDKPQDWFHTGDLVKMTEQGAIELMGRKKDFIKNARGEIVYFKEVEDAITPLAFINDFGILSFFQDECEKIALLLEVSDSFLTSINVVEEIKTSLISSIGVNKIPSVIKVVEKIPRSKHGKLLKTELNKYL